METAIYAYIKRKKKRTNSGQGHNGLRRDGPDMPCQGGNTHPKYLAEMKERYKERKYQFTK